MPARALPLLVLLALPLTACSSSSAPDSTTRHDSGAATDAGHDAHRAAADAGEGGRDGAGKDATRDAARDAVSAGEAAVDATPREDAYVKPGEKIAAAAGKWTWVPFDDAYCADGSTTGLGVNLSTTSSKVIIYLEGGGACWNDLTCYELQTASYLTGYSEADFVSESTDTTYLAQPGGFFDRTASANPFKDYSFVYVPYCTGDVFGGDVVATVGTTTTHFVGFHNMGAYLARIVPTFANAERVILAGSSAGGFGAGLNWWRTQQAFGSVRVDLLDDSGTAVPSAFEEEAGVDDEALQSAAWGLAAAAPPGCDSCQVDPSTLYGFYDETYPTHRGALLSYTQDSVLPSFFGISTGEFTSGLDEDLAAYFKPSDPLKSFVINQSGHVLFFSPELATSSGVTVMEFVSQMVDDDAAWKSVGP